MARRCDPASKLLTKKVGGSLLRPALPSGVAIERWLAATAELAHVQHVADGLIEPDYRAMVDLGSIRCDSGSLWDADGGRKFAPKLTGGWPAAQARCAPPAGRA